MNKQFHTWRVASVALVPDLGLVLDVVRAGESKMDLWARLL